MTRRLIGLAAIALLLPHRASAQDTRTVTEPRLPSACTVLEARLTSVGDSSLAESDERSLDNDRIQRALDRCPRGQAVKLVASGARRAFLVGPLSLRAGVTLLVDSGAIVFGSRDPRLYDLTPGSCGVIDDNGHGCRALIGADGVDGAGVMGDGVIDGRGWADLLGQSLSCWALAQTAKVMNRNQNCPRLMILTHANDFTLYRITLRNSANFHVYYGGGKGFTAWGVKIWAPKLARNTDGIDPANSSDVTITHSFIHAGDDNVAIKAGSAASSNMTISHNHFYAGHGMSIGSETNGGVDEVLVTDLTVDGADNGLRIKSNAARGGPVTHVTYEDVCVRKTKEPIFMDTHYSASPQTTGTLIPVFRDVTLRDVRVLDAGRVTLDGYDADRRLGLTFDGVTFGDVAKTKVQASHADVTVGPRGTNLAVGGDDVRVQGQPVRKDAPAPNACDGRFVPFPGR
jgi:polygalacturonase